MTDEEPENDGGHGNDEGGADLLHQPQRGARPVRQAVDGMENRLFPSCRWVGDEQRGDDQCNSCHGQTSAVEAVATYPTRRGRGTGGGLGVGVHDRGRLQLVAGS